MSTYLLAFIAIFVELCYIDTNIVYVEGYLLALILLKVVCATVAETFLKTTANARNAERMPIKNPIPTL